MNKNTKDFLYLKSSFGYKQSLSKDEAKPGWLKGPGRLYLIAHKTVKRLLKVAGKQQKQELLMLKGPILKRTWYKLAWERLWSKTSNGFVSKE
jgi:hypothetical protein